MFQSVPAIKPLYSCSFGKQGLKRTVKLRTAFKSNTTNEGLGEIEALLYRQAGNSYVCGYKSLPRPIGPPLFELDHFSRKSTTIWKSPALTIPSGLVCFNTEPGCWVLSPAEDMEVEKFTKLLEGIEFQKLASNVRKPEGGYGEKNFPKLQKDGLAKEDQLIILSIESFIENLLQRSGTFKYEDEFSHFENDLARLRIYHSIYREKSPNSHELFVNAGSFRRVLSNGIPVLRPTSELLRMALLSTIRQFELSGKRFQKEKNEGKAKHFFSEAQQIKTIVSNMFPSITTAATPKGSQPAAPATP